MQLAPVRVRVRAPVPQLGQHTLLIALVIGFPVIGFEQILHTSPAVLATQPVYQAFHWLSDSLLALPFAVAAVWGGEWLARRFELGASSLSDVFTRACIVALLLALLLVPGEALHDQADRLTHTNTHASLGFHSHAPTPTVNVDTGPQAILSQALHGLTDGIEGQAVGLPLAFIGLLWVKRRGGLI